MYVFTGIHKYTSLTRHITFPIPQVGNEQIERNGSTRQIQRRRSAEPLSIQPVCLSVTVHSPPQVYGSNTKFHTSFQWNSAEFRAGHRNRRGYSIPCFTCTALLTSHQPPQVQNTAKHGSGYRAEGHRDVYMANEGDMGRTVTYNSAKHIVITQAQQVVANYTRH
jgi:hypothetical protein